MIKSIFKKGFTLIELLVVISMIGLLSSIVLASLGTARVKASDAAIKSDLRGIISSAEIEYASLGYSYNKSNQAVNLTCTTTCTAANTILQNQKIQDAIQHIVANNGGQPVTISIPSDGKTYAISTPLSSGSNILSVDNTSGNVNSGSLIAPTILSLTKSAPSIRLVFNDNNAGQTVSYQVESSTSISGPYNLISSLTYTEGTYPPTQSTVGAGGPYFSGITYYFRVRIVKGNLYSAYTPPVALAY